MCNSGGYHPGGGRAGFACTIWRSERGNAVQGWILTYIVDIDTGGGSDVLVKFTQSSGSRPWG